MTIPNQYHFVFALKPQDEPFHIAHYLCLASCLEVNKPEAIHFYYHYEPYGKWWDRIKDRLVLHRVQQEEFIADHPSYQQHQEGLFIHYHGLDYAHQSDFIRLKILLQYGGVYADIDTLFVNPLPRHLFNRPFVLAEEVPVLIPGYDLPQRSICNAVILSQPRSSFGKRWLKEMYDVFDGTWSRHSCQAATRLAEQFPSDVHVTPHHYFYKHPCTVAGIHTLLRGLDDDFNEVYSMHLWEHLWWSPDRRDFSTFDASQLTEYYIASVDTTYNVVARRFLPDR